MEIEEKMTLAEYLKKKNYYNDDGNLKDDFVYAIFKDINKKLDLVISSQKKLLHHISTTR